VSEPETRLVDLLDAIAEGDRAALEHLYGATSEKLYGVVLRILRRPDLAAQALPAAYLRIWRDALQLHARAARRRILARHACAQGGARYRAHRAELGHEEMAENSGRPPTPTSPEDGREISDELRELLACLATLNADPRLMLLLAYFDGWSRAELAVEFDAPAPTVRTWMLRGLEQIRDCSSQ
jgi:RNA polymerase sigma-70 factor, ECF subfamily